MQTTKYYGFQEFTGVKITEIKEISLRVWLPGLVYLKGMAFKYLLVPY